ncbi:50S ribosomal protein L16 [Candidatus Woesearchaeota archaeon]|jgi:large subunit ribosomal protein L10e|nr:50S ribosomal protein L16 [Candidatus Woesearchaeota archaeon]MBT4114279.1 50S ribosomal protein L16 [Candidatus Woesearchaeota archaeon]MBT4248052.1 50S ribosomal protein L16 [Candidatus Woesearchaeota archaeon]
MAKLRAANAYRRIKRAYTRTSKYKKKAFIKGIPGTKIHLYDMGDLTTKFPLKFKLIAKKEVNLRHNALEAGRMTATHTLAKQYGKKGFALHIHAVPHHVMRENALATGAGADRMQTGMRSAFGKAKGLSAHVRVGKVIMTADVPENGEHFAREALRKASAKFPIPCKVERAI